MERLMQQKAALLHEGKSYDYINFYRNKTTLPEDALFKPDWIRKYICAESRPDLAADDVRNFLLLRHVVKDGEAIPDLNAGVLHKRLIVVLADAKRRRPNHVVLVAGYEPERDWIYLLNLEVGKFMFGELLDKIYRLATNMRLEEFYTSKQAADALRFYVEERNRRDKKNSLACSSWSATMRTQRRVYALRACNHFSATGNSCVTRASKNFSRSTMRTPEAGSKCSTPWE